MSFISGRLKLQADIKEYGATINDLSKLSRLSKLYAEVPNAKNVNDLKAKEDDFLAIQHEYADLYGIATLKEIEALKEAELAKKHHNLTVDKTDKIGNSLFEGKHKSGNEEGDGRGHGWASTGIDSQNNDDHWDSVFGFLVNNNTIADELSTISSYYS